MRYQSTYPAAYVAQYIGGGSDGAAVISAISRYTQVTGWAPSILLLGQLEDVAQGLLFSLAGGATSDNATDALKASLLNQAMFQFADASADAVQAPDTSVLDVPDAPVSSALLITFRVPAPGAINALGLYGKRDTVAPNDGAEALINTAGDGIWRLDADATVDATRPGPYDNNLWHTWVGIVDRSSGMLVLGSETDPDMAVALPTGSAINAVTAALGAQRRPAIGHDDAVFGFQVGLQVDGRSANRVAEAMAIELYWEILVDDDGLPLVDDNNAPLYSWVI